jgi:tripartite-type tricarboxylate transporter receptor subunit TctC
MLSELLRAVAASVILLAPAHAVAQSEPAYPSKPIRWIVPFAPGSTDLLARIVAQKASESLGQQLVIESRPGAGGSIGTAAVARSAADGYTILMGTIATHGINSSLYKSLPYDAVKDFAPVCLLGFAPNVLIVNPAVPARTVKEFIDYARKNPGVTFSSPGAGTSTHMAGEQFQLMTGLKMTHVPYKGTSDAVLSVLRGDAQSMFSNLPPAMAMIKDGRVRAIAVTSPARVAWLPELPTIAEEGLPGYDVSVWFGVFAPAGTPEKIVERLANEFITAASDPGVKDKLFAQGFVLRTLRPAEFGAFVRNEIDRWEKVVRASGAKVE